LIVNTQKKEEMNIVIIMNKRWDVKELAPSEHVKSLVSEYKKDPNCSPFDWVGGEKISEVEKAAFIHACSNCFGQY
jgi:hypothetical protein